MRIIGNLKKMSGVSCKAKLRGKTVGFVPTMGALHEGHLSLIRQARKENDIVAVSIFVNPVQFGPKEDFKKYPRNLRQDAGLCKKEGVDFIFCPSAKDMYPQGYRTYVKAKDLSAVLCAKFRPGHFQGVATVVAKLFNIVNPNTAYFGQKDAQQAIIIKRMIEDLNMPVKVRVMPVIRQKDGLALSSRNIYLNKRERNEATVLFEALNLARDLIKRAERDPRRIIKKMRQLINKKKSAKVQYIAIVNPEDLRPKKVLKGKALIALAVWFGKTRLVDNIILSVSGALKKDAPRTG